MTGELPTLPTRLTVIDFTDNHAPRTCQACGDGADHYCLVTHEEANDRLGTDLGPDEAPVNAMLCTSCFRQAPRASGLGDIIDGAS